ncbi:MAG: hypothetical protein GF333_04615 [Candidatus Omnitrophica bacterium]|nr:hypothetical protein [Candidatus Omnitrophota bacterium]
MLCDVCQKNAATVHLTEIVNEKVVEMHICQECARHKAAEIKDQVSFSDFLTGLSGKSQEKKGVRAKKCPGCGSTYREFRETGRLGCAKCYAAFREHLLPLVKKIHGSVYHQGKRPLTGKGRGALDVKIRELQNLLNRAIQLEEYEEAARLRDELKRVRRRKKSGDV